MYIWTLKLRDGSYRYTFTEDEGESLVDCVNENKLIETFKNAADITVNHLPRMTKGELVVEFYLHRKMD